MNDLFVTASLLFLKIEKNSGQYSAGTAGRCGNNNTVVGILFAYRVGVCTYLLTLNDLRVKGLQLLIV